jgi:hypothetical protein
MPAQQLWTAPPKLDKNIRVVERNPPVKETGRKNFAIKHRRSFSNWLEFAFFLSG